MTIARGGVNMKKIVILLVCLCILSVIFLVSCDNDYSLTVGGSGIGISKEPITYSVNFETNGGTAINTRTVSSIDAAPFTSKEGYDFMGWYSDAALRTKVNFPLKIDKNITLYAKWEKSTYYVTFVTNDGTDIETKKVSELKIAPVTTKSGSLFDGWYLDKELTVKAIFPLQVKSNMTLYAKWLLLETIVTCKDGNIKFDSIGWTYPPTKFDFHELAKRGYDVKVTASYTVRYKKDYNVPLDIGYLGSPKYEASLYITSERGSFQYDLGTSKAGDKRTISYIQNASAFVNNNIRLEFSSDNVQNRLYFEDVVIKIECIKK